MKVEKKAGWLTLEKSKRGVIRSGHMGISEVLAIFFIN